MTVSEFLRENQDFPPLEDLATGSWNAGNLDRWIGSPSKNRYWEILERVRWDLEGQDLEEVWDSFYAAEGSDYPWWFDSMPYRSACLFEEIFLAHIRKGYRLLRKDLPPDLPLPLLVPPSRRR